MTTKPIDTDLDTHNPGAAVGIVALIVLVLGSAGGIAVGLWFLAQVTR